MRAHHLGTESNKTGCPALYATDRRTFIVQGWKADDPQALAGLVDIRDGEFFVEIPKGLVRYDDGDHRDVTEPDRPGRPAMFTTSRDTYLIRGWEVTDPEAIADLIDVRENETFVEIPKPVLRNPRNGVGDQVKECL